MCGWNTLFHEHVVVARELQLPQSEPTVVIRFPEQSYGLSNDTEPLRDLRITTTGTQAGTRTSVAGHRQRDSPDSLWGQSGARGGWGGCHVPQCGGGGSGSGATRIRWHPVNRLASRRRAA